MPFLDPTEDAGLNLGVRHDIPKGFAVTPGAEDLEAGPPDKPAWNWGASFRRSNIIGSMASSESLWIGNEPEPGFSPWDRVKGTPDEADWKPLASALNQKKFDAIKRDIAREREDRKLTDSQPWWMSLITEGAATLADPTILIPGGAFVRGARGGFAIARTALSTGLAAGVSTAAQEAVLQATQQDRTAGETAQAIGASIFIGGLLGGAGAALLSKGEWARAVDSLNREIGGEARPAPVLMEPGDLPSAFSVGAAAAERASLDELSIAGAAAGRVAAATQNLNPALRLLHSDSAAARETAVQLFENSTYLKMNMDGLTTGQAVETLMKEWNGGLATALRATNEAYPAARKAGFVGTEQRFREEVGRAMRRNDTHPDPHVAQVAQAWRSQVFDPLKDAAIKAGLLPEDVTVETAASYFSRQWNVNKLVRQEGQFKGIVTQWAENMAPKWARAESQKHERFTEALRAEVSDLEMGKLRRAEELRRRDEDGEVDTGEFRETDIRAALRLVETGAPKPKGVETLTQFIAKGGGLVDFGGELAARGITNKSRPGFVRARRKRDTVPDGGLGFDDAALRAWEAGYFPHLIERPTIDDFLEALEADFFKTRAVLRQGDEEAFRLTEIVEQLEQDLNRLGVDRKSPRFSTSEEVKGIVARVHAAQDAADDRRIASLKAKLHELDVRGRQDFDARFGDPAAIRSLAQDIANEVFDKLTGKTLDTDARPEFFKIAARGPLKERTFNIPDELVEDFLESDVAAVGRRYTRVMGADVEIKNKFGDLSLEEQQFAIREEYRKLREGVTDEKKLAAINEAEKADKRDLLGVRDLLRGTNEQQQGNWAAFVRSANAVNYLRSMGEVVLASLTDTIRPAMVHGLRQFMGDLPSFATNAKAIRLSVGEAQLAGNVGERVLAHRLGTLTEIIDPYSGRGPIEAFLSKGTDIASKWNGIRIWTDWMKSVASVMTQNRVLGNVQRFGQIANKERAYLAYLGIDQSMAERIAKQFDEFGETIDRVHVANTAQWTDEFARRAYRAAINKDVDSIIVQKSVADVPSFANTPTGRILLQFKSFALASHQKVLLRGLQEDQSRFVGGMVAMTLGGMFITWMKAISGNREEKLQDFTSNPGWWVGEGLDRSGILSVPMELSNMFEKASATAGMKFNPIKSAFTFADEGSAISQKNQGRNFAGSLIGPTGGMIEDALMGGAGVGVMAATGEDISQGRRNAAERLMPFNSYLGVRQMMRYLVNPPQ